MSTRGRIVSSNKPYDVGTQYMLPFDDAAKGPDLLVVPSRATREDGERTKSAKHGEGGGDLAEI
jgi:hypothetical protein